MAESKAELTDRWRREGREEQVARFRQQVRDECRARGVSKEEAHETAWSEAARNFPPLPPPKPPIGPASESTPSQVVAECDAMDRPYPPMSPAAATPASQQADSGRVQGLADIPTRWPEMPANASLAAEIAWVQANRLYVVEERPSGATVVRLDRAHEPAPSRAAIGWLETSIRSYAKYVEVAAKATATQQDEQELVRHERMAIEEIRSLLAEMMPGS